MNEMTIAGPANCAAAGPGMTNMPDPMMAPMPMHKSCQRPSTGRNPDTPAGSISSVKVGSPGCLVGSKVIRAVSPLTAAEYASEPMDPDQRRPAADVPRRLFRGDEILARAGRRGAAADLGGRGPGGKP